MLDTSLFLAQFWGWLLVITSVMVLFRGDAFLKDMVRLIDDKGFLVTTGYLSLVIGLASLLLHNTWTSDVYVLITIFGWIALLKGIVRMTSPKSVKGMAEWFIKNAPIAKITLIVTAFLGLWLLIATR